MARRNNLNTDLVRLLRNRRLPWWAVLLVVAALFVSQWWSPSEEAPVDTQDADRLYRVERVIDGDTFVLAGGERVRLIGVNTPETVAPNRPVEPFGPEASAYTKSRLEGREVKLEFDKERRDRYGRLLAFVYVDGDFLNEELVRLGFGRAELKYSFSSVKKQMLREAEAEAQSRRRGLWALPSAKAA